MQRNNAQAWIVLLFDLSSSSLRGLERCRNPYWWADNETLDTYSVFQNTT